MSSTCHPSQAVAGQFFFPLIVIRLIMSDLKKVTVNPGSLILQGLLGHFLNCLKPMPSEGGKKQAGIQIAL